MNWNVALRLGRVSNLPTVTTNVLAGITLAGAGASVARIAVVCVALSMMYVAGMYLNDAFDRDIDRVERPDRPIPSGQVSALAVFQIGYGLLLGGILAIAILAMTTGVGWSAVLCMVVLAALIVFYDANHKQNPLSPLVMGLCRAAVYVTAGYAVSRELSHDVVVGAGVLVAYLIGLTYIARAENLKELGQVWPLGFLAVPFFVMRPTDGISLAIYVLLVLIVAYAVLLVKFKQIRMAVTTLIAGMCILDALVIARGGNLPLASAAVGCWFLTRWLHRKVPGT